MTTFIICGYGIPKDIRHDQNYTVYLHTIFNRIYELAAGQEASIIPCGGPTNCEPPYQGTEAQMISDYLNELSKREATKAQTSRWKIYAEEKSLSTLENLLFAKEIMQKEGLTGSIVIFCEKTRESTLAVLATHIFSEREVSVSAIDFDTSKNRYLDPSILQEKEMRATKEGLWTLQSPDRLQKHHELFQKKIAFLRQRQTEGLSHVDAVKEWFENEKSIMQQLMPDHPFLKEEK